MSFGGDSPFDVLILSGESPNSKYPHFYHKLDRRTNIYQNKRISKYEI